MQKPRPRESNLLQSLNLFSSLTLQLVAHPSSVKEKTDLCNAGLGDTTILLEINDSSVYLHEEILKTFPKLNETGGYELLLHQRGGGGNGRFHVIKPPPPSAVYG